MRIILDEDYCPAKCNCNICEATKGLGINITDKECDKIHGGYCNYLCYDRPKNYLSFSGYLLKLIELKRSK